MKFLQPLIQCDAYKLAHMRMYPEGTNKVYSNLTARSLKHAPQAVQDHGKVVWFGLQALLLELNETWNYMFFNVKDVESVIENTVKFLNPFIGSEEYFDQQYLYDLHELGYLPLEIKALPEGSHVNVKVPMMTITNTVDEFFWLPGFLETWISAELWKPITSATIAASFRRLFTIYAELTGGSMTFVDWQAHDFSMRGMSGVADAKAAGAGHLLFFKGTDTIPAVMHVVSNYPGEDNGLVGGSVPASEHSVASMYGIENERQMLEELITKKYPTGVVSIVSDTWNLWKVLTEYAADLKSEIMSRDGRVVFRPDSGDPYEILCGRIFVAANVLDTPVESIQNGQYCYSVDSDEYYIRTDATLALVPADDVPPETKGALLCLWDLFGGEVNAHGCKVLDEHVRLIYGDSITLELADDILRRMAFMRFSSDNVVFGVGSRTYQFVTRDTLGLAMKSTYGEIFGEPKELWKDPVTDDGTKKSARGLIAVQSDGDYFFMQDGLTREEYAVEDSELRIVYKDGVLFNTESFGTIRARAQHENGC